MSNEGNINNMTTIETLEETKASGKSITKVITSKRIYFINYEDDHMEISSESYNGSNGNDLRTYYGCKDKFIKAVKRILKQQ